MTRSNDTGAGKIEAVSELTCPRCGRRETATMPTDACQWYYDCKGCGETLRPAPGDCCVYCSYGSVPCPPVQKSRRDDAGPPIRLSSRPLVLK